MDQLHPVVRLEEPGGAGQVPVHPRGGEGRLRERKSLNMQEEWSKGDVNISRADSVKLLPPIG